jgi:MoaA/NifB/PqqE/SkfB family radical SAM enzyme
LNAGKKELDIAEFKKISRSLGKLLWLHISGGEPFLREDLPEICEIFAQNNRPLFISIPTNGFDPERIERIGTQILQRIRMPVAIDLALDDIGESHDLMRGSRGSFENLLISYDRLMKMGRMYPHLSTKITTVISNKNFDRLEAITDFVYKKMKGISFHTIVFMRGKPRNPGLRLPEFEQIMRQKDLLLATWANYGFDTNLSWPERVVGNAAHTLLLEAYLEMIKTGQRRMRCLAGQAHAVIGADGEVFFCELLESIGNLRDHSFEFSRLWRTPKAQTMRKPIENKQCWCTHGCVFMDNIFLNIANYPLLFKESLIYALKRLKRNNRYLKRYCKK